VQWNFPHSQQQQLRMAVFADLHEKGYFLTSGSKFGGDFLAYPGDPNLYHAQFVVRVLRLEQALNPVLFKGLARGVHAARKHLLLASVVHSSCNMSGDTSQEPWQQQQQVQWQDAQQQQQLEQCQGHAVAGSGTSSAARNAKVVYITVAKEDGFGASK
jgi:tRNA splicing endonuclease